MLCHYVINVISALGTFYLIDQHIASCSWRVYAVNVSTLLFNGMFTYTFETVFIISLYFAAIIVNTFLHIWI